MLQTGYLQATDENEVNKTIMNFSNTNAVGIENLSSKVIKELGDLIFDKLSYLFNFAIPFGVFPDSLKQAEIVPV